MGELRAQLTDQAQTQTQRLAENVRRLSQELRELGENGKPDSTMADVARQIAAQESSGGRGPRRPAGLSVGERAAHRRYAASRGRDLTMALSSHERPRAPAPPSTPSDASTGDLIGEIGQDVSQLVRTAVA
ncbi:hypothetical protein AB0C97_35520 [Streptomyces goshikiensis]|uniref:hypothetical protein n=1 Tax=Streptomyces goshikiensis TaxID=1942 RepID=UPI0033CD512B